MFLGGKYVIFVSCIILQRLFEFYALFLGFCERKNPMIQGKRRVVFYVGFGSAKKKKINDTNKDDKILADTSLPNTYTVIPS